MICFWSETRLIFFILLIILLITSNVCKLRFPLSKLSYRCNLLKCVGPLNRFFKFLLSPKAYTSGIPYKISFFWFLLKKWRFGELALLVCIKTVDSSWLAAARFRHGMISIIICFRSSLPLPFSPLWTEFGSYFRLFSCHQGETKKEVI